MQLVPLILYPGLHEAHWLFTIRFVSLTHVLQDGP